VKEDIVVMSTEHGHRKMRVWQNIDKIDILVQNILKKVPKNEFKLRSQIDSASDSTGANYVEGYYSGSLAEYIRFCRYAKRSLAELQERVRRTLRKGYIDEYEFNEFDDLAIKTMFLFDRLLQSLEKKRDKEQKKE
jgi:four helix bundle protein